MEEPILGFTLGSRRVSAAPDGRWANASNLLKHGFGMLNEWEQRAACQDTPIELWFGDDNRKGSHKSYRTKAETDQAKAICASCPVLAECRSWALEARVPFGILGGLTERERLGVLAGKGPRSWVVPQQRSCAVCGTRFWTTRDRQRFCSPACYYATRKGTPVRKAKPRPIPEAATATVTAPQPRVKVTVPAQAATVRVNQNSTKTHCKHGHPFDEGNTGYNADGSRWCRTCARERARSRYQAHPLDLQERQCAHCGTTFVAVAPWHHYCNRRCNRNARYHRSRQSAVV